MPTQAELDRIAGPILDALELMHAQSFLHRDIAPDNIIVRADGSPVLLDFGAARRAVAEMSRALTGIVKMGYSPQEQYTTDARLQGPWTDLYALGPRSIARLPANLPRKRRCAAWTIVWRPAAEAAKGTYRPSFLSAIDACLKVADGRPTADRSRSCGLCFSPRRPRAGYLLSRLGRISSLQSTISTPVRALARQWPLGAVAILVLLGGAYAGLHYARWEADERHRVASNASQQAELKRQADGDSSKKAEVQGKPTVGSRRDNVAAVASANPKNELTLPPNVNKQFSIVQGAGVKGEQYRIVHGSTLASCTETCMNERSCIMFSHWKNGTCYLFNTRFETYPISAAVVGNFLGERGNVPTEAGLTGADKRFRVTRDVAVRAMLIGSSAR